MSFVEDYISHIDLRLNEWQNETEARYFPGFHAFLETEINMRVPVEYNDMTLPDIFYLDIKAVEKPGKYKKNVVKRFKLISRLDLDCVFDTWIVTIIKQKNTKC